ncbi:MAG TPA: NAD(P)/FAD-dependent oxidoreductase [Chloroflexota bacterium]|nr:NAD(P)/FAD-dependent oxidoreductase [Chloroflexota bacterium]
MRRHRRRWRDLAGAGLSRAALLGLGAAAGWTLYRARNRRVEQWAELARRAARRGRLDGPRRRVLVLGAGFGGLSAAVELARLFATDLETEVLLLDRHNYHLFTPLLYHAATGLVAPSHITYPVRAIARATGFAFQESRVEAIDLEAREVHTDDGRVPYDALIVALGSTTNFFGLDTVERYSLRLKEVGDAIAIRNRIIDAFEQAELETDPERRRALLTFVVVGGGATGVELVGAIHGYVYSVLVEDYPAARPQDVRIVLAEAGSEILHGIDRDLADHALRVFRARGIEVLTDTPVRRVTPEGAETADGTWIPARTVVWTAGVRPVDLISTLPGERGRDGRLAVAADLSLPRYPDVYVIGDAALFRHTPDGTPLPPNAPVAIQQGRWAAQNLWRRWHGLPTRPFRYRYKGELVSLGRHTAIANIFGVKLTGFPAWAVWRAYYLSQLHCFRNQAAVALDWSFAYFWRRDTARLESEAAPGGVGVRHEAVESPHR